MCLECQNTIVFARAACMFMCERESGVKFSLGSTLPGNDLVSAGEGKSTYTYMHACVCLRV